MSDVLTAPFAQANRPSVQIQSPFEVMRQAGENQQLLNSNKLFQAQVAAGRAQQQAIDPATGQYSPDLFRRNLAAAGPGAAPAAQSSLAANQSLSSDQLNQARDKVSWIAKASQDALTKGDFSDGAMLRTLMQGNASGVLTMPEIGAQLSQMPPDPAGRKAWLEQHQAQALSSQQHLDLHYGVSGTETDPTGRKIGTKQMPQTGALSSPQQPGVALGPSPEVAGSPVKYIDKNGVEQNTNWAGYNEALRNGTAASPPQVAPNAPPGTGRPGPIVPVQPGGAATPQQPATPPAAKPAVTPIPGPAPGSLVGPQADATSFKADQLALPAKQTSVQNLQHAYEALQLTTSGKSAEATHAMFGYLQTNGLLPAGATDELKNYELFRKYTERNVADLGNQAGTDAGRSLAAQSNAGTSLSTPANIEVLRNDIGKQNQAIAIHRSAPDQQAGAGYGAHTSKMASNTDPRGFAWNLYSPKEQADILKSVGKDGSTASNALHRAIGMAHAFIGQ